MRSTFKLKIRNQVFGEVELSQPKIIKFSDGTIQVQVISDSDIIAINRFDDGDIIIEAIILDSDGIIALCQLKDIIDYYINPRPKNVHLILTYTPYARYDRRMTEIDSFSLKVFGNIVNSLKFDRVYMTDVHSTVSMACINNSVENISQLEALSQTISALKMSEYEFIVSPDVGALKKATSIAEKFGIKLITALKKRDEKSGYTVFDRLMIDESDKVEESSVLIVDDLCDYGRTFVNLAENLKKKYKIKRVDLFVSHGLFSGGNNLEYIDNIFCFNDLQKIIISE